MREVCEGMFLECGFHTLECDVEGRGRAYLMKEGPTPHY
jgi:hypothetical protein